jgi:tetratricopeptide (TPR) repeat protein
VWQLRGLATAGLKQNDAAVADFDKALAACEKQKLPNEAVGVLRSMAPVAGADATVKRFAAQAEKDAGWALFAAELYQVEGKYPEALAILDKVLADRAKLTPVQLQVSLMRTAELSQVVAPANLPKAKQAYRDLLALRPQDWNALNNLSYLLLQAGGDAKEALVMARRAYESPELPEDAPQKPVVADTYAAALLANGDADEAIRVLNRYATVDRISFAEGYLHLGEAHLVKKRPGDARTALERAQEMVAKAKAKNVKVDEVLTARLDAAMGRLRSMEQTGGAPGGAN